MSVWKLKKLTLNKKGVRELLRSTEVQTMLRGEAEARCPAGCSVDIKVGTNRANARIKADTAEAYRDGAALEAIR